MRVSIRPLSNDRKFQSKLAKSLSVSSDNINDDMECQFCQALVKNVRNILISNTTEAEFIQVLSGLCKQTGTFAKEVVLFIIFKSRFFSCINNYQFYSVKLLLTSMEKWLMHLL